LRRRGTDFPEYEREPSVEGGKDVAAFWGKMLVVVVVLAIVIGYVASVSYQQYPYEAEVSGTYATSEGGRATIVGLAACNAWVYQHCPDPGQVPTYDCQAPPQMNMGPECVTYNLEATPGHYDVSLRNGENYTLTGYLTFQNGTFDKVCFGTIVLSPPTHEQRVARDLSC
jgi:hypothetical protein